MGDLWNEEEESGLDFDAPPEENVLEGPEDDPVEKPKKSGVLTQREKEDLIELGKAVVRGDPEEIERVRKKLEDREQAARRQEAEGDTEWDEENENTLDKSKGFESEGDRLDRDYPSMSGRVDNVPKEMRNELDPDNESRRQRIIEGRVDKLRNEAFQKGARSHKEVNLMARALQKELAGVTVDELYSYRPETQTDYQRLRFKIDSRFGHNMRTADGETIAEKAARDYPSMNDPEKELRKALDLPEED
ncbi:MAG: hypothetical protein JXQ30_16745 [Spirochaetes bacterium]|nr:hypothetical protein [Spirochaetota bacterium]